MRKFNRTYYEALEELEFYRLKDKYEPLGFTFLDNLPVEIDSSFEPDAVARHNETGEFIFFEIKAFTIEQRFSKRRFQNHLNAVKTAYPNAKFLLVVARPRPIQEIYLEGLDRILLGLLTSYYIEEFNSKIFGVKEFETVEDISITKLNARVDKVKIEGYGNVKFIYEREDNEILSSVSDGVPFKFRLTGRIPFRPFSYPWWQGLIERPEISFDYSEFV